MFGLGSICDKIAGETIAEEYLWLADLGCAGLDALTGNYGGAVGLALKAGASGAGAAGNKTLADGLKTTGAVNDVVFAQELNQIEKRAAELPTVNACTDEPGLMICSDTIARRAAFAGGGAAIGAAKGGRGGDIREGLAIGGAASGLADSCLQVKVDTKRDAAALIGNASLLGRDTAAFATAIAVAAKGPAEKREAQAIGGAISTAADLPGAAAEFSQARGDLAALLAIERTVADFASIACDGKARALTGAGMGLVRGVTEEAATAEKSRAIPVDDTFYSAPRTNRPRR